MNLQDKTLLITGITGFIGARAAELALQRGMKVQGLARSAEKAAPLKDRGVKIVVGDITDPAAAATACQGVDLVLHTAAIVRIDGDPDAFRQVNLQGAVNMAQAAKQQGVKAFVHLSSVMVYGFNYPPYATESSPLRGENNPYCQTKIDSERELLKLNQPPEFGVIIIRPGDVYGPNSGAWVVEPLSYMHRKEFALPRLGKGRINHVYVDNLIDAIFLAIEQEAYGEVFNITDGQDTSCKDYFTKLAAIANAPPPIVLPTFLVKFLLNQRIKKQQQNGEPIDLPPDSINWMSRPYLYSIEKARTQLGYQPKILLNQGLEQVKLWLQTR
ncbi:NAD-dependent epimerase/dehydratase family protein [Leptolyngbya sp. NK1-12]|uniref:NAD-dependent epimerase/dehydratase family protein n=1 Tax=Leptolyngbya sp. NK1-12 TaxID=2547451 RepID=A0AA97AIB4_9CYAN|nr:NAD-dependent epimerase/dehydratase family protein [Leptolyngbya sp. NK1-12]